MLLTAAPAYSATILAYTFQTDAGADFSSYVDGTGPFVIQDIAATADGEAFTFDLTISGVLGDTNAGIDFNLQRVLFNADQTDHTKSITVSISDIQGAVTFDGFVTVDRFDNGGGDFWDVNGTEVSAVGNNVALAAPISGDMVITATGPGGATGNTRLEGFEASFTSVAVPEPSSTALLGLGGLALILRRRK